MLETIRGAARAVRTAVRGFLIGLAMLALFASHSCKAQTVELGNMPPDGWGGRHAHLGYSAVMGAVFPEFVSNRPAAFGACFAVGVWKEWKDYHKQTPGYRRGLFSRKDLQMDALGCAIGAAANWGLHVAAGPSGGARISYTWEFK